MGRYERVDAYLRRRLETLRTPGLAVVVVEGGAVAFSRGYGWADAEAGRAHDRRDARRRSARPPRA